MSLFRDLMGLVKARIESDEFISASPAVPVLVEDKKLKENLLSQAVSKRGACVIVTEPTVEAGSVTDSFTAILRIGIWENTLLNRSEMGTNKMAFDIGECIIANLHQWQPSIQFSKMYFNSLRPESVNDDGDVVWIAEFKTESIMAIGE